jgi:hypothetical protein
MTSDRDLDLKALLSAIMSDDSDPADLADLDFDEDDEDDEPQMPVTEFGRRLAVAARAAIDQMRADGSLEVEEENVEALVAEVAEAGLEANSPKQLLKKVLHALLDSERVEEIYGTDEMIKRTLSAFLGGE